MVVQWNILLFIKEIKTGIKLSVGGELGMDMICLVSRMDSMDKLVVHPSISDLKLVKLAF